MPVGDGGGKRFALRRGQATFVTVDVAELGPALLTPADSHTGQALLEVQDATVLIVATPAYQGSYSGALKVLLDQLPANALAGVLAVPVVTADVQAKDDRDINPISPIMIIGIGPRWRRHDPRLWSSSRPASAWSSRRTARNSLDSLPARAEPAMYEAKPAGRARLATAG